MKHLDPSERLRRANEIVSEFDNTWGLAAEVALISNGRFATIFSPEESEDLGLLDEIEELEEENESLREALDEIQSICHKVV